MMEPIVTKGLEINSNFFQRSRQSKHHMLNIFPLNILLRIAMRNF